MNEKLLSLMGIARKAGRLSLGYDPAEEAMRKGKSKLLLIAKDVSERTLKSITAAAQQTGTRIILTDITMDAFGAAVGKRSGIVSVNDRGFAEKMEILCSE